MKFLIFSKSERSILTFSAISSVPAFPGKQNILSILEEFITQIKDLDDFIKDQNDLEIS